ncbi:O-antigen ligase family protein [Vibrio ruber]|uniref:O-antigen ligase family protein n=1 Tax=Vibrio ruber TaxID=184755 RepID=UPI002892B3AA|nr:O-antigen ligase family protein [Vibrio ruber]WNJ96507.1 O-antigen ligase family protein [Vibrio ruber]
MENTYYRKIFNACLFLVPALLLCTKNFSIGAILILLLTAAWYLIKEKRNYTLDKIDWMVIIILSAYFIANIPIYLSDMETTRYFKGASRYLFIIPIYFFIRHIVTETTTPRKYLDWGIVVGAVGTIVIAIYQFYIKGMPRVDGYLYSINFGYLSCSLAFLAFTLANSSHIKRILWLSFLLCSFATILTLTRGAIFAIPLLIFCSILFQSKQNRFRNTLKVMSVMLVFFVIFYTASSKFQDRINYTITEFQQILSGDVRDAESSGGRIQLWYAATQSFIKSPLIGQTYSQREETIRQLYQAGKISDWPTGVTRAHAHNQYFEMLASNGVLGILAFIALIFTPLFFFFKHIKMSTHALTGFIFVLGFSIFCLTEVPLEQNLISSFYGFILAVLINFTRNDLKHVQYSET